MKVELNIKNKVRYFLEQRKYLDSLKKAIEEYENNRYGDGEAKKRRRKAMEKMEEVVKSIGDAEILKICWGIMSRFKEEYGLIDEFFKKEFQARASELVLEMICEDINALLPYIKGKDEFQFPGIDLRDTATEMAKKLIEGVSPENVPDWFVEMMGNPGGICREISGFITAKAEELYKVL